MEHPTARTVRPTNEYMESVLFNQFPVLDQGHIIVTDYMGDEASIIESARLSYGGGLRKELSQADIGLLRYLKRQRHTTPFESCEIKIRAKMPIFVARQWVRHRTASINEQSARYTQLDKEFYIPDSDYIQPQSSNNKQGRSGQLTDQQIVLVQALLLHDAERAYNHYLAMLNDTNNPADLMPIWSDDTPGRDAARELHADPTYPGIARELARMNLTLNTYTTWIWKIDLHNLLHFLSLRADAHAQYEIRVYADKLSEIVHGWLPHVYAAFLSYTMNAFTLSAEQLLAVKLMLDIKQLEKAKTAAFSAGIGNREWQELIDKLDLT